MRKRPRKSRFDAVSLVKTGMANGEAVVSFEFYSNGLAAVTTGKMDLWDLLALAKGCRKAIQDIRDFRKDSFDYANKALAEIGGER